MKVTNWTDALSRKIGETSKQASATAGAVILAGGVMFCGSADADTSYFEDFESVTLNPGTGMVPVSWSRDVAGWTVDNSGMTAKSNAIEYQGGAILDIAEWIAESGGQGRTSQGTIAPKGKALVFDPDEWDDEVVVSGEYNSSWSRVFDFTDEALSTIEIGFDYEFRAYDQQRMLAEVSFDGGATYQTLLDLDSATIASSDYRSGGAMFSAGSDFMASSDEMILKFSMTEGGNDWWGVIDNISVTSSAIPEPSAAGLIGLGALGLANRRRRS